MTSLAKTSIPANFLKRTPVLTDLIRDFNGDTSDAAGHINHDLLIKKLAFLRGAYSKVISTIRAEEGFAKLPIIIHGYDVPFPYPFGPDDGRNPIYAANDKWLGSVFKAKGIPNETLGREILRLLIDHLYSLLSEFSRNPRDTHVWLVDCRGALPEVSDWNDEIHGTSEGFAKVAGRFIVTLNRAIAHAES